MIGSVFGPALAAPFIRGCGPGYPLQVLTGCAGSGLSATIPQAYPKFEIVLFELLN